MKITYDGHDYIFIDYTLRCATTGAYIGEVYLDFAKEYVIYDNGDGICGSIHVNNPNPIDDAIKSLIILG